MSEKNGSGWYPCRPPRKREVQYDLTATEIDILGKEQAALELETPCVALKNCSAKTSANGQHLEEQHAFHLKVKARMGKHEAQVLIDSGATGNPTFLQNTRISIRTKENPFQLRSIDGKLNSRNAGSITEEIEMLPMSIYGHHERDCVRCYEYL